jgi:hypothetical protein
VEAVELPHKLRAHRALFAFDRVDQFVLGGRQRDPHVFHALGHHRRNRVACGLDRHFPAAFLVRLDDVGHFLVDLAHQLLDVLRPHHLVLFKRRAQLGLRFVLPLN